MSDSLICSGCKIEKSVEEFCKDSSRNSGYSNICKDCNSVKCKSYYKRNRERCLDKKRKYVAANHDKVKVSLRIAQRKFRLKKVLNNKVS